MASILNPYLNFDGNTREAMEFYQSVLGGQLDVMTFGQMGGEPADGVMHAYLGTPAGFHLMASDGPPGQPAPTPGGAVSLSLSGDDHDELTGWFHALAEGGTVLQALEPQMWGDTFGMCVDRFGIQWLVNISGQRQG
ncbi:VOC family protein [Nocardioides aestuarii]|uniref:VOC family protein n=1 Tax=Nocardioides aestuarii TaxID=252231 RepID=A0ABW4TJS8_9ACTN